MLTEGGVVVGWHFSFSFSLLLRHVMADVQHYYRYFECLIWHTHAIVNKCMVLLIIINLLQVCDILYPYVCKCLVLFQELVVPYWNKTIARSSAARILISQDERVLVFYGKGNQIPMPLNTLKAGYQPHIQSITFSMAGYINALAILQHTWLGIIRNEYTDIISTTTMFLMKYGFGFGVRCLLWLTLSVPIDLYDLQSGAVITQFKYIMKIYFVLQWLIHEYR